MPLLASNMPNGFHKRKICRNLRHQFDAAYFTTLMPNHLIRFHKAKENGICYAIYFIRSLIFDVKICCVKSITVWKFKWPDKICLPSDGFLFNFIQLGVYIVYSK